MNLTKRAITTDIGTLNTKYRESKRELQKVLPTALIELTMGYLTLGIINAPALMRNLDGWNTVNLFRETATRFSVRLSVCVGGHEMLGWIRLD